MKLSQAWLSRFVPHGKTPEQVRDLLTAHVATVEGLEALRADLAPIVVAQVVASEKVPDTKLSFNKVDDGSGELLEVICGANNVVVGNKYPFARSGTTIPTGLKIEKRKIRGYTSNGMLCSADELKLGTDHDGIYTLDTGAAPGTPFLEVLPLGDVRIELDVLPNRPDLLSHLGVARELSALTGVKLAAPAELADLPTPANNLAQGAREASAGGISVRVDDNADCPRYMAAVISGVTVCPSPDWLREAVESVGGRSINNVVDATNYMLHGFGQPMHAFDKSKLGGAGIVVRRAKAGETLVTLDGVTRKLDPEMLVIADAERATALAGVMGGKDSEVSDATTDIVLEVATFSAKQVRVTRRKAGLSTDASYRFERGVDDAMVPQALALGAALLAQVSGGHVEALLDVGAAPEAREAVRLSVAKVARVLGDAVPTDECARLLGSIGFTVVVDGETLRATPPSWRHDVSRDVDLIEEIARLRGFDHLPDELTGSRPTSVPDHPLWTAYRRIRDAMVAAGLHEVRPLPFTSGAGQGDATTLVRVQNPLAEDEPYLRATILDTLARRAEYNLNRMQGNVRLFEVGSVFAARPGAAPREAMHAALLVMGQRRPAHFTDAAPPALDAWDAKALATELAAAAYPGATLRVQAAAAGSANGADALLWTLHVGEQLVGEVRRVALDAPVWASPAFGVELTLGEVSSASVAPRGAHAHGALAAPSGVAALVAGTREAKRYVALPTQPAAEFDLALLVPDAVPAGDVEACLRTTGGDLLERVMLFDEFRGKGVPEGTRSLAWRLTFRHPERTLREKELEGRRSQLLKTLENQLGVRPRS
ncbi:MAG TPA: phenylalanine--tRNA ligase subunit beta [Gemmatimonadaceae bacterium]|nr:phenylalanine--tRNA ligase subunit beta [Gemmatimonadaceae bacterium]